MGLFDAINFHTHIFKLTGALHELHSTVRLVCFTISLAPSELLWPCLFCQNFVNHFDRIIFGGQLNVLRDLSVSMHCFWFSKYRKFLINGFNPVVCPPRTQPRWVDDCKQTWLREVVCFCPSASRVVVSRWCLVSNMVGELSPKAMAILSSFVHADLF